MAIAFRASSSGARGGSSPLSVAAPTGTASGDLLLMIASSNNNFVPAASGYTSAGSKTWQTTYRSVLLWKIAGSSEPAASVTTGGSSSLEVLLCGFSGVDGTTPFDVAAVWGAETTTSPVTVPSVTTLTANAWWLVMAADNDGVALTSASKPTGWTQRALDAATQIAGYVCDTVAVAVAGVQTATSFPKTGGGAVIAAGLALRESGASPPGAAFVPQVTIL